MLMILLYIHSGKQMIFEAWEGFVLGRGLPFTFAVAMSLQMSGANL